MGRLGGVLARLGGVVGRLGSVSGRPSEPRAREGPPLKVGNPAPGTGLDPYLAIAALKQKANGSKHRQHLAGAPRKNRVVRVVDVTTLAF